MRHYRWRDPSTRQRHAEASRATRQRMNADQSIRASLGWLTADQIEAIANEVITTNRPHVDIAVDWMISRSRVSQIAAKFGALRSKPRK